MTTPRHSRLSRRTLLQGAAVSALGLPTLGSGRAQGQAGRLPEDGRLSDEERGIVASIDAAAEPLPEIASDGFASFIDRFAEARVILLGESTHGTDEFYRARAAITERLIAEHGFTVVAIEADWPDAARIDAYVRGRAAVPPAIPPFQRFPVWMWRNRAMRDFVDRLHALNQGFDDPERRAGIYGLDLYSLPSSMDAVVDFVRRHDPEALDEVRARYGCLAPWVDDPAAYGAMAQHSPADTCSEEVVSVVRDVIRERMGMLEASDAALFDALRNAQVVAASEAYYRAMYEGSVASWNLRDTHMFETLQAVLEARGPDAKAVVWAHNSHIGNAAATQMGRRGEINIGQLCREAFGSEAVLIGLGTDRGTVTAAHDWNGEAQEMQVRPSISESWGALMREAAPDRFFLDIRNAPDLADALDSWRPERFIGVIYRPETERVSHYAEAGLSEQFDAYLWFEETQAVAALPAAEVEAMPETYPFAL